MKTLKSLTSAAAGLAVRVAVFGALTLAWVLFAA
jgi:hypothetical protein